MRKILYTIILTAVMCGSVHAQCDDEFGIALKPVSGQKISKNDERIKLPDHMAPVKSSAQLVQYINMTASSDNPLHALSDEARTRFIAGLTFNDQGLTGYRYTELENELTPTQIAKILSLFGAQQNTSLFKKAKVRTVRDQRLLAATSATATPSYCDDPDSPIDGSGDSPGSGGGGGGEGGGGDTTVPPPTAPRDYVGYRCYGATCKLAENYICTHNCKN